MTEIDRQRTRAEAFRDAADAVSHSLAITGLGAYRGDSDGIRVVAGLCGVGTCCPSCHDRDRQRLNDLAATADADADAL